MKKQWIFAIAIGLACIYGCSKGTESSNEPMNTVEKTDSIENESKAEAAKKAFEYVNGERTLENHQKAYQWALKADSTTKAKVIQLLKDMDFPIPN